MRERPRSNKSRPILSFLTNCLSNMVPTRKIYALVCVEQSLPWSIGFGTKAIRKKNAPFAATAEAQNFVNKIQELQPNNDSKRAFQARVLGAAVDLAQVRLALFTQAHDTIPVPFLAILIFWLAIIFTSFGLFVRSSPVVIVTFFVGALSVACAIFLILEMDQPFAGLLQISSEPLRHALAPLGR